MSQMFIKKKVGKKDYTFVVDGKNLHELIMESQKFSFPDVYSCGLCKSDNLTLSAHVAKDKFCYTTINCLSCKGQVNFGQQQKDPDIFYIRTREDGDGKGYDWKPFSSGGDDQYHDSGRKQDYGSKGGYNRNYNNQGGQRSQYDNQGYPPTSLPNQWDDVGGDFKNYR